MYTSLFIYIRIGNELVKYPPPQGKRGVETGHTKAHYCHTGSGMASEPRIENARHPITTFDELILLIQPNNKEEVKKVVTGWIDVVMELKQKLFALESWQKYSTTEKEILTCELISGFDFDPSSEPRMLLNPQIAGRLIEGGVLKCGCNECKDTQEDAGADVPANSHQ